MTGHRLIVVLNLKPAWWCGASHPAAAGHAVEALLERCRRPGLHVESLSLRRDGVRLQVAVPAEDVPGARLAALEDELRALFERAGEAIAESDRCGHAIPSQRGADPVTE